MNTLLACCTRTRTPRTGIIDLLPDEILDEVFKYLSTPELAGVCAHVCQRWRRLAERRALNVRTRADGRRLAPTTRGALLTAPCIYLSALLDDIAERALFLRELTVHAVTPLREKHVAVLRRLPHLTHLDVFTRPHALLERLADVACRLHTLVINDVPTPTLLRALAAGSQLSALHMYGNVRSAPARELTEALRARAPYLRELTLRCTELPESVYCVVGECSELRSLQLYGCWQLRTDGARAICRLHRLRRLHVTGARLLYRSRLGEFLTSLPGHLDELSLSGGWFSDEHVDALASAAPELRTLELWLCGLSTAGCMRLAGALAALEALDVDLRLPTLHLRSLARRARLRTVRCVPGHAGRDVVLDAERPPVFRIGQVRFVSTDATYAQNYFRPDGVGFRSGLFYFWTRDVPLEPLMPIDRPGRPPPDDYFYPL